MIHTATADQALQDFLLHPEGSVLEISGEDDAAIRSYLFPRLFSPLKILYVDTSHLLTNYVGRIISSQNTIYCAQSDFNAILELFQTIEKHELDLVLIDTYYNIQNKPKSITKLLSSFRIKAIQKNFNLIYLNQMMMNRSYPDKSSESQIPVYDRLFQRTASLRLQTYKNISEDIKARIRQNKGQFGETYT